MSSSSASSSSAPPSSPARAERAALADLFDAVGPDAPTLCEGWSTRDLAAHLVVRESRLDAAPGIVVRPLAGWTARVQRSTADTDWPRLVQRVRSGPPAWSALSLPGADRLFNTTEYFVHHEDVRRAAPGWAPRDIDGALDDALWGLLRTRARALYRNAPVGVVLRRTAVGVAAADAADAAQDAGGGDEVVAHTGEPQVVLRGPAQELLLHAFGRQQVAQVSVEGDEEAARRLAGARLGV
jgi:uncharacterized protein (TIGR03085 family)